VKLSGTADVQSSGFGSGSLTFEFYGSGNGATPQGSLPLSWDFTVGTNNQVASASIPGGSYYLEYNLNDGSFVRGESGGLSFDTQCGDSTCAHVVGKDFLPVDGAVRSYDVSLTISGFFSEGAFLQVTIPDNSIDMNPQAAQVATPEPASMALGLSGLLGLAFAGFRRRRKV
jgi:MYXO-CTERM domain-containing protein